MLDQTTLTEKEFLIQISERDPEAFQDLVRTYFPVLCRFAENFLPDSSLAEDVVQETFIKFWKYEGRFDSYKGMKSFLYTMTRNGCLNLQRGRLREETKYKKAPPFTNADTESVYDEIVRLEYLAQINQVVKKMPVRMQEVFLLSFQEGLTIEEISAKLKISVKTVRNQKYKSLTQLRKRFGNNGKPLFLFLACFFN